MINKSELDDFFMVKTMKTRLDNLEQKYGKLLPNRQRFMNVTDVDRRQLDRQINDMEHQLRMLKIQANDLHVYVSGKRCRWQKEKDEKRSMFKSQKRNQSLHKARTVKADNKVADAINNADANTDILSSVGKSASAEAADFASTVTMAQILLRKGRITQEQFKLCIAERWTEDQLMDAMS